MDFKYTPKYIRESLSYVAGEIIKHSDYNRNLNLLHVAVDNNTEALTHLLNSGGTRALNSVLLDDATLVRHRVHILEDNDEQVPSSKAVYEHVETIRTPLQEHIDSINSALGNHSTEMFNINKRIQVVNSLMDQYNTRADRIEALAQETTTEFEFTYGTLRGGSTGQVLAKASNAPLDYRWTGLLDMFYPVGTIYETTSTDLDTTTKMNTYFGGTWEVYGTGRVLVAKSADTEFDTIDETGGDINANTDIYI